MKMKLLKRQKFCCSISKQMQLICTYHKCICTGSTVGTKFERKVNEYGICDVRSLNTKFYRLFTTRTVRPMAVSPHGRGTNISPYTRHFTPWTIPDDLPCIDVSPHERGAKRLHNHCRTNLQARYDLFCVKSAVKPQPTNRKHWPWQY